MTHVWSDFQKKKKWGWRIRAENTHRRYDMPSRKTKKSTPVDIMVKPHTKKTKDQEKSLKAATEKSHVTFKELREMYSWLLKTNHGSQKTVERGLQYTERKQLSSSKNIHFKDVDKTEVCSDLQKKTCESVTSETAPPGILKDILQTEGEWAPIEGLRFGGN